MITDIANQEWMYLIAGVGGALAPTLDLNFSSGALDSRITFTRAAGPATYFNAAGILQTASTNVPRFDYDPSTFRTNIYLRSSQMEQAPWFPGAVTTTTGTLAPDGTTNAVFIKEDATNATHNIQQSVAITIGVPWTISFHAKAGTRSLVFITGMGLTAAGVTPRWDVAAGTNTTSGSNPNCTHGIQNVGGGWYRCWVTFVPTITGAPIIFINNNSAYQGDNISGLYLWGAQCEQGALSNYIPTTNVVGVVNAAPRGLLIEEARTNLVFNSNDFSTWGITPLGSVTTASNAAISPDGTNNASSLLTADTLLNNHSMFKSYPGGTINTAYVGSIFVKARDYPRFSLSFGNTAFASTTIGALFDLSNGTIVNTAGGSVATIVPVGNGWYRVSVTATSDADGGNYVFATEFCPASVTGVSGTYTPASVGLGGFVYGADVQVGAFPTSYIPTTTAATTRPTDVANMPLGTWFNAAAGTLVVDVNPRTLFLNQVYASLGLSGDPNNTINLRSSAAISPSGVKASVFAANIITCDIATTNAYVDNTFGKAGFTYAPALITVALNGGIVRSAVPSGLPAMNVLNLGWGRLSSTGNVNIRRVRYWPRALPSAALQLETT